VEIEFYVDGEEMNLQELLLDLHNYMEGELLLHYL
jgi:hypothetical protein